MEIERTPEICITLAENFMLGHRNCCSATHRCLKRFGGQKQMEVPASKVKEEFLEEMRRCLTKASGWGTTPQECTKPQKPQRSQIHPPAMFPNSPKPKI
eukprot:4609396-Amphidinium_carterae.1